MAAEQTDMAARPASMAKADAKRLTAQIRRQLGDVQQRSERLLEMVRRARRENAWAALGYASESQWIAAEFPDLSRGQKYRLVAWGQVVSELEAVTKAPVEVSGRQAAKAKKAGTSVVAEKVRQRLASIPEPTDEDRRGAVADALAEPIEASGTKVDPAPSIIAPPEPQNGSARQVLAARARATTPTATPPDEPPPAAATAADLIGALRAIDPATAAASAKVEDLDELMGWVGLVRAAIRRLRTSTPAAAKPAKVPAAKVPAAATKRPAEEVRPADCTHPVNRIIGTTCVQCGAKVGK